jgi:hypothetical protein
LDDFAATGTALLYCCGGRFGRSRRSRSQSRTGDCRVIERGSIERRCPSYADLKFELVFGDVDWIFAIRPGSEFDAEPCLRRPAIRRCACARADRGDRKRLCPHPRDRAVARRIPPRALRLPQRLGVGRVARRQLHRALPKLRDRVSEPPLDKLMTLQGYMKNGSVRCRRPWASVRVDALRAMGELNLLELESVDPSRGFEVD